MTRAAPLSRRRPLGALVTVGVLLALVGCGGDDPDAGAAPTIPESSTSEEPTDVASPTEAASSPSGDPAPADDKPFGPDCGRFRTDAGVGPAEFEDEMDFGIFSVIFTDLVGDAAALMNKADLMAMSQTTYFLPSNEALEVLNQAQMGDLLFDEEKRRQTMGRHVVAEPLPPSALDGEHKTASANELQVTVDGEDVSVGLQGADVLCGNIQLEQGVRVYVIDQLLLT